MRSGYMLRQEMQRAEASQALCGCGHARGRHYELPRCTYELRDGQINQVPNPDFQPLHFHCEDCDCVVVRN